MYYVKFKIINWNGSFCLISFGSHMWLGPKGMWAVGMDLLEWRLSSKAPFKAQNTAYLEYTFRKAIYEKHNITKIIESQPINK
jgi:hypothetical protein